MPAKGFTCLTISRRLHTTLKSLAKENDMKIPELLRYLITSKLTSNLHNNTFSTPPYIIFNMEQNNYNI